MKNFAPTTSAEKEKTFDQTLSELSTSLRKLIPEANLDYYKKTNEMHCDTEKPGGSKFTELGNILEVLKKDAARIDTGVENRKDDRDALLAMGISERAFLPATKTAEQPEGLPEALYFKVEGVKGKLGIVQLKDLHPRDNIIVRREKSVIDEKTGKEKVPCSFSVIEESMKEMPDVDFATVIIGREGGENGKDELWTIHPGAPIKAADGDFIKGSEELPGPVEGEKQKVILMTVGELLKTGKMTAEDYVKINIGDFHTIIKQYETLHSQEKIKPVDAINVAVQGFQYDFTDIIGMYPGYVAYDDEIHNISELKVENVETSGMCDHAFTIVKEI